MHKLLLPFFLALLLFCTCAPTSHKAQVETIVFDYSCTTSVFQYNRIESVSFTPLDGNCLIGNGPELRLAGDNLFILHGRYSNHERIDRYNTQGEYLNQIGRSGRGPGEIATQVCDWFLYGENMMGIVILSNKVLLYDFAGNFIREIHVSVPTFQGFGSPYMTHLKDSNYLVALPAKTDSSLLIRVSETGAGVKPMLKSKKTYPIGMEFPTLFFQSNGQLYYSSAHDNTIYKVEQDTVILAFLTDPGKYAIPQEFYNNLSEEAFNRLGQNGVAAVYYFLENSNYYVIQVAVYHVEFSGLIWGIIHKGEKEWFWSKMEIFPLGGADYNAAVITDDNRLMVLVPPVTLKEQLPLMKNVLNPQVVASLNDDDNPVLVEIKLK